MSSYTYGWAVGTEGCRPAGALTAHDLIDRALSFGVRVVQLCDNLPPATYEPESVEAIAEKAAHAGVAIELGTRGSRPDHLRRFARIARRLSSPILRVVLDTPDDHPTADEVVRRLTDALPDFSDLNVTLAIENHDRFDSQTLADIVTTLNTPHVGICLDTVNSFGALEGPRVVVETLAPHTVNLHLKDFAVTRLPHLQGFTVEGRPAGQGMLDIPWLLGQLKSHGRNPNAILELWTPPEPDLPATVRKEAEWARASVRAARQWITD